MASRQANHVISTPEISVNLSLKAAILRSEQIQIPERLRYTHGPKSKMESIFTMIKAMEKQVDRDANQLIKLLKQDRLETSGAVSHI